MHYRSTVLTCLILFSDIYLPQEDELSRSIASCKVEASTVIAWISFLEDTWKLQSLFEELKEKQAKYVGSLPEQQVITTITQKIIGANSLIYASFYVN